MVLNSVDQRGWRFYSRADFSSVVERFVLDGQQSRLTQAALETLAVIAYRQPISRARVSAIRGVNVEAVMKTLVTRGLAEESGVEHETGAILYRTTSYFLLSAWGSTPLMTFRLWLHICQILTAWMRFLDSLTD